MPRRFGHPDAAAKPIDKWMRTWGASIMKLDSLGDGWPDRCYGIRRLNILVEIKTGKRKLKPEQVAVAQLWRGDTIHKWSTPLEAAQGLRNGYGLAIADPPPEPG